MKKVLFYTENYSHEEAKGGTEVATWRIARALKDTGTWEVFNAFRKQGDTADNSIYDQTLLLPGGKSGFVRKLSDFIREKEIDAVVNMTRFFRHEMIYEAIKASDRNVKLIFMQHFAPGSEFKKGTFSSGYHLMKLNPTNPLYWLRTTLYPLLKIPRNLRLSRLYRKVYQNSDKVVLLSEGYKRDYRAVGEFQDESKFEVIPNIYDGHPDIASGFKKEKRVLILSRMDEIQKRLSLALRIWRKIEDNPDLGDWHLDIVGGGHNMDIVKRLVKKLKLENVTLHGWQDRKHFLERSSILMLTSEYEGLPLSLLETQAYGVVPIAFNSFASLEDVVTNYENGVIIEKFGDIEDYSDKLTDLMNDGEYREELMKNALCSKDKFSSSTIAEKWLKILT